MLWASSYKPSGHRTLLFVCYRLLIMYCLGDGRVNLHGSRTYRYNSCTSHLSTLYRNGLTIFLILNVFATIFFLQGYFTWSTVSLSTTSEQNQARVLYSEGTWRPHVNYIKDNLPVDVSSSSKATAIRESLLKADVTTSSKGCVRMSRKVLRNISKKIKKHSEDKIIIDDLPDVSTPDNAIKLQDKQWSKYVILRNIFQASDTSLPITVATQSSIQYLNHVVLLVERWRAPISVAVWVPGYDFFTAVTIIAHLRCCYPLVEKYVSFSFLYPVVHQPMFVSKESIPRMRVCPKLADLLLGSNPWLPRHTYIGEQSLYYPVNAARNVAKSSVMTPLVLVMDIELLPSEGLANKFIQMIKRTNPVWLSPSPSDTNQQHSKTDMPPNTENFMDVSEVRAGEDVVGKTVYVLPAFEVAHGVLRPRNKVELLKLLKEQKAGYFHVKRCRYCHIIPNVEQWKALNTSASADLNTFMTTKWLATVWEPVFISRMDIPPYDERFVGYGANKIQQAYELCRADYDFHVLDNAFVMHQGMSKFSKQEAQEKGPIISSNKYLLIKFMRELDSKYEERTANSCKFSKEELAGQWDVHEGTVELIAGNS